MCKRNFKDWLKTMRKSINQYNYYIDFPKIYKNVEEKKVELHILNALVGSKNIKEEFVDILHRYPEVLECIPIILAVRANEIYAQDENGAFTYNFHKMNQSIEQYVYFMEKTGLFDLIANHIINNLYDYCLGVETGLDTNGRKNRGGDQMEDLVERYIQHTGVEYYKEMYLSDVEEKWSVDLSAISAQGTTTKRWDFVVKTQNMIYVIETNFYPAGGSKLNETSRSYKMIAEESKDITDVKFVWITDGGGWKSAARNLEETFQVMDTLYNIADMENGTLEKLFSI